MVKEYSQLDLDNFDKIKISKKKKLQKKKILHLPKISHTDMIQNY